MPSKPDIHDLFEKVARRYDLINDLQSLGLHRRWKQRVVEKLAFPAGGRILDLACGSGDLALQIQRRDPQTAVFGGDLSRTMLRIAARRQAADSIRWLNLDALRLPFRDQTFHAVTIGYGLRNFPDRPAALDEIRRILKPGGRLVILEFAHPPSRPMRILYSIFLRTFPPLFGWLLLGDRAAYDYILESLARYPTPIEISRLLEAHGFSEAVCDPLMGGAMTIHSAAVKA
ncbi:MAG: bifunctional demethylmenaquinone methyltransferase/2-methoxy-6-polyprenyl-1,4-benzoquinol methylase UbiE [Verrucomicrobiae bacterium]|nr:bifunctional demethylmenaquinone methyltransferase/2-methoxy-6-polyprenyl-1,4-benzoquinol methylase UbiE [Verrucomicrobiae bacterium]